METRRTCFRNMRSKCQCSCVLQFTRHLRVSSVLHRPLSQMIHCIVLYLAFSDLASERFEKRTNFKLDIPTRGDHKLRPKGQSHRPETSRQTIDQPSTVLPVKHTSLTARTSDKPLVPGGYRCSNTRLDKPIMILPQVHLRKPCYDFYFL